MRLVKDERHKIYFIARRSVVPNLNFGHANCALKESGWY